ncbi:LysE family translocator [Nisaea sediminum]|uniref:LysE family translocator n=1 Tax=Nisaea sediminum TaxID=2775867 RepID=UPI0018686D71|nr:LysE family transporter [Nisaea sediminum]
MLSFATAIFFLIITPGIGVLTAAGVGAGYGFAAGIRFLIGLCIGTNAVAVLTVTGIAAIVLANPILGPVLLYGSVAYLLYLAFKIGWAGSKIAFVERQTAPGIVGGFLLQLINPKAYAVNTTLFSGFHFMPENMSMELALKFLIINAIWVPVHLLWLWAGVSLKHLDLSERSQSVINKGMALSMLIVVGLAAMKG